MTKREDILDVLREGGRWVDGRWGSFSDGDRHTAADEIVRLRAAQWPEEVTEEMREAVYALNLGKNRLSEDDVIDVYDTFRKIVLRNAEQTLPVDEDDGDHRFSKDAYF